MSDPKVNIGCGSDPKAGDEWLNVDAYRESDHHHSRTHPDALADAHALPIHDGAATHARIRHVLEHLDHPMRALREAERVVEPGGTAYVEVPDPAEVGTEREEYHTEHLHSWTAGSLERACLAAGFATVEYAPGHAESQRRGHAVVATVGDGG